MRSTKRWLALVPLRSSASTRMKPNRLRASILRASTTALGACMIMICHLLFSQLAAAQAPEAGGLDAIRKSIDKIDELLADLDGIQDWHRDGLNRRIDGLGLDALDQLHGAAPGLLENDSAETRQSLIELLDRAAEFGLRRVDVLEQRAAEERSALPKFEQGAEADIARAFMQDLNLIGEQYLSALVDQVEIRRAADLDADGLSEELRERISLIVDILTGQVRLDAMTLNDLRARLAEEPLDENLQRARALVQAKQSRNLGDLERLLDSAERLGIPVAEQRSLLLRERGKVGVELLRRDVFAHLWSEQLKGVRESVLRNGPNYLFRSLLFVVLLLLAWLAARLVRVPVRAMLYRESVQLSTLLRETLIAASGVIVFTAGLVLAIGAIGVSLGPVLAGLGVLGIIVGLAVQDSLGNLAAGAMILIYRPYDVDDLISVDGAEGLVKRMNLLATTIVTFDNQSVAIPNGRIWGNTIINHTAHRVRRVDIKVGVTYREDPDRVIAVLEDLVQSLDYVLDKPKPAVHVADMEESSVAFMIKPWVRTEDYWTARWDLPRQVKKRFDAEGIEIPFPQRVVTLNQIPSGAG